MKVNICKITWDKVRHSEFERSYPQIDNHASDSFFILIFPMIVVHFHVGRQKY